LMKERIMIRRLKSEVLDQLPEKQRTIVMMPIKGKKAMAMKEVKEKTLDIEAKLLEAISSNENVGSSNPLRGGAMEYYTLAGAAKADPVCEYVYETARSGEKFLVFCHHVVMMDALEKYIKEKIKCGFIRIDGKTKPIDRQKFVKHFQTEVGVKIAILSITAAGEDLTLTAARIVLFAELYWCPSNLLLCEDRVDRIGQKSSVNIYYLLGENTIDDVLWPLIKRKVEVELYT
jgi:SWI/SNF-related matrix-associated actin-dependent regulator 1 of chromatin subfamily A